MCRLDVMSISADSEEEKQGILEMDRKDAMHTSWEQLSPRHDHDVEADVLPSEVAPIDDECRPLISQRIEARKKGITLHVVHVVYEDIMEDQRACWPPPP